MSNKIIISPSKEMSTSIGKQTLRMRALSQEISKEIQTWSKTFIGQKMNVNEAMAEEVFHFYQAIHQKSAKPAYQTYTGLAFRQIEWDQIDLNYAKEQLVILSALYGPLSPKDPINPYRLDFTMGIKIEGKSIKTLWKKYFREFFKNQMIYNLASKEFSSLIDPNSCRLITIDFLKENGKNYPSATSKKLRGQLTNHLLKAKSFEQDIFESFLTKNFYCNYDIENLIISYQKK